jgi:hypothetical protein
MQVLCDNHISIGDPNKEKNMAVLEGTSGTVVLGQMYLVNKKKGIRHSVQNYDKFNSIFRGIIEWNIQKLKQDQFWITSSNQSITIKFRKK